MAGPDEFVNRRGRSRWDKLAAVVAMASLAAAGALAVMLAVRRVASYDLGYHLAYGDQLLDTGRIVQSNHFIWTPITQENVSGPQGLGPSCTYDAETKTYRFVNANWLSQAAMAAVNRHTGGMRGLWVMPIAMVAAIFAMIVFAMRRGGVGWHLIAAGVLLTAMTAYERFSLRPELFGYLVLVAQWVLLASPRFGWRAAAGVIALQVLAVNFHSYFLLGIAVSGAMLAGPLARWVWARAVTRADTGEPPGRLKWLAIAAGGCAVASLANPWLLRGALMPVRALLFIRAHDIAGTPPDAPGIHPWAAIGEFTSPFSRDFLPAAATYAYALVLALAAVAGLVALLRRRWAALLVLAGMTVISLRMRRNIAPAAMILVPLGLIVLSDAWGKLAGAVRHLRLADAVRVGRFALPAVTVVLSGWWMFSLITHRFYFAERRPWRFGAGVSKMLLPIDAADWIKAHRPAGRVFCGYDTSSNLLYLARPAVEEVPILTNTWAYPPAVMQWVLDCTGGRRDFDAVAYEHGINTVVLRSSRVTGPLMTALSESPRWAVVHVATTYAVFVRRAGPNADLARSAGIDRASFDRAAYVARAAGDDPLAAFALHNAGVTMLNLNWGNHAIEVWRECLRRRKEYPQAAGNLGWLLTVRGANSMILMQEHTAAGQPAQAQRRRADALYDWAEAKDILSRERRARPNDPGARARLEILLQHTEAFGRGTVLKPRGSEGWKTTFASGNLSAGQRPPG